MTVATTIAPTASKFADKLAASSFEFNDESRPLTADEFKRARYYVKRLDSARGFIAGLYGSPEETDEFEAARERYEEFLGDDRAYLRAMETDRELILPDDLQSYARYSANLYDPGSTEHTDWSMLRSAEVDLCRLIDDLAEADAVMADDLTSMPVLVLDGVRFSYRFLTLDDDITNARLVIEEAPNANRVPSPN